MQYLKPRDEAIEHIESYIIKNGLKPGDRLPSERAMCEMWKCNRSTLRSAIQQLIQDGKIYQKNGSGTYVAREKLLRDLQEISGLYQTATDAGRTITTKVLGICLCEADKTVGQKMKLPLGYKLWRLERVRNLDGIPVVLSKIYLDAVRFPDLNTWNLEEDGLYKILKEKYGVDPSCGHQKLSITYCDQEEAEHLQMQEGAPVIYQSGITMDENHRIFEYFKEMTRSEYVYFGSELTRK